MVSLICTLQDHRDDVNWCAFSATLLATCSGDKTLRIYNTKDFSDPCGQFLASCSTDATVVIWSMVSGEIEAVLEHPGRSPVRVCALSPDSAHLVSGASDGSLALWDFPSKQCRRTSPVNDTTMVACSFSPCSQLFVTGSTYGDLRLWDLELNQLQVEKNAHDLGVSCCAFSPDIHSGEGQVVQFRLASCGQDSLLKIWAINKLSTGAFKMQPLHALTGQSAPVLSCAYSADGQLLVSGRNFIDVTLFFMIVLCRYVTACSFSPTASIIATGSMDKTVNIWRVEDGSSGHGEFSNTAALTACSLNKFLLVSDWSEEDVSLWLVEEGLEGLVDTFRTNNIDGTELLSLTKETLASELHIGENPHRTSAEKVDELKSECVCSGVPDEFLCPITRELMKDPVIAADGYSYEREAIESWINTKNRSSPMTNLPLLTTLLTPNHTLKMAIGRWKTTH
uniref:WD repeat, SAM and U-box domain-containing protein 1 n=1 Tax=Neogobius melanostomus TaxID=47308 RepID=A0A8C6WH71_9GOBI